MKIKNKLAIAACLVLLTGCGAVSTEQAVEQEEEKPDYETIPSLVPVADYTGEEYELRGADPDMEISAEMEAEIETAVKEFFIENYKTEVKMNRYFKGDGYVRAVVESAGYPVFYTDVNVGVEKDGNVVTGVSGVGALDGQVEQAVTAGLLVKMKEQEFQQLDQMMEEIVTEYPVVGTREEVATDVTGQPYATPYYYVTHSDPALFNLLDEYKAQDQIDERFWDAKSESIMYETEGITITIALYMKDKDAQPNPEIAEEIEKRIVETEGIPRAWYAILLHDNNIVGRVGFGEKKNTLTKGVLDPIVKE